jgi:peptide/nickel transport system permease protein
LSIPAPTLSPPIGSGFKASFASIWRGIRHSRSALIGLALLLVEIVVVVAAPILAPYSPDEIDPTASFESPSVDHWAGTDQFGRDVFSRTLYGGRIALIVSVIAATLAVGIGAIAGLFLAYVRGKIDDIAMRVVDALLSIPVVLALLVIIAALGSGLDVTVIAVVVLFAPGVVRVVRGAALEIVPLDFVTAARTRGEGRFSIILRELRPNVLDVILVEFAVRASWVVLLISALSFLGFGVNPPTADWGVMIAENRTAISIAPWASVAPLIALSTLVIALNLASDGIAKALGIDRAHGLPG